MTWFWYWSPSRQEWRLLDEYVTQGLYLNTKRQLMRNRGFCTAVEKVKVSA